MKFVSLSLLFAGLIGCNCGGAARFECNTPEQCKLPECVNSGCNFTDAGKPLPPKRLGTPSVKLEPLVLQRIELDQTRQFLLDAHTQQMSKACSNDHQGAGFFTNLSDETMVRARVTQSEQVSLAVFKIDLSGKRQLFKCVRSFSPDTGSMTLGQGRWEFVITGKGAGAFSLTSKMRPLRLHTQIESEPTLIKAGAARSLAFSVDQKQLNALICSRKGSSYRAVITVTAPLRLTLSANVESAGIHLGLKTFGATDKTFCAPPMNQRLVHALQPGRYELIVESALRPDQLNLLPWALKLEPM